MQDSKRWFLALALLASATASDAQTNTIILSDPRRISVGNGTVTITSNPGGPDTLQLQVANLEPNQEHTVYLAASPVGDALPVQYLGSFRTAVNGAATFSAVTEVLDAYAASNPAMTDKAGVTPPAAGVLASGAFAVPLDWIRIYRAQPASGGAGTVFSKNGAEAGGAHLLSTDLSFNGDVPLLANAGPDITVRAPDFIGDASLFFLDGAGSRGGIKSYTWTITESNAPTAPLQGCYSGDVKEVAISRFAPCGLFAPFDSTVFTGQPLKASQVGFKLNGVPVCCFVTPQRLLDLAGLAMTVQLTIRDAAGNTAIDTLRVTFR
jgi:hypothetical protein